MNRLLKPTEKSHLIFYVYCFLPAASPDHICVSFIKVPYTPAGTHITRCLSFVCNPTPVSITLVILWSSPRRSATMMDHITEETCPLCQRDLACSVDHKSRSMLELISPLCVDISTKYKLDKSRFPGLEEERRHGRIEPVLVLASDPRARRMTRAVRRLQQTNRKWVAGS